MKDSLPIADGRWPMDFGEAAARRSSIENRKSQIENVRAFTLVELLVVITLLSLIVLALMAVFNSAQTAFRASVTQTDVLEGGRATMDMITADLRQMAPSLGYSNSLVNFYPGFYDCNSNNPVNFYANTYYTQPLPQSLVGASNPNTRRTNVLENFFVLSRGNLNGSPTWFGTGYAVNPLATNSIYPLYRFYLTTNVEASPNPAMLFNLFMSSLAANAFTNAGWSHLLDGVVTLRVHAYDTRGVWMTNGYPFGYTNVAKNVLFLPSAFGETSFCMFSNTLPASVEIELGVLEDRALQRAESLGVAGQPPSPSVPAQWQYLQNQAGKVHLFRQRVTVPNVDPSAYQ